MGKITLANASTAHPYLLPLETKTGLKAAIAILTVLLGLWAMAFSTAASALSFEELTASDTVLPIDKAFRIAATLSSDKTITVTLTIAPNHYLYKDKLRFDLAGKTIEATLPAGVYFDDPNFGQVEIYRGTQTIRLDRQDLASNGKPIDLTVTYQGCSDRGICYPLSQSTIALKAPEPVESTPKTPSDAKNPSPDKAIDRGSSANPTAMSLTTALEGALDHSAWSLFAFFALGILMAATPCLFPLLPVVLTMITGTGESSKSHPLPYWPRLLAYTIGFVVVYVAAAVIAALSGHLVASVFQSPAFLIAGAIVYGALGLSMFGLWRLDWSQNRLAKAADSWIRGHKPSVARGFVMGLFSALISTPCISPALAGVLLYIAKSGNWVWGAVELTVLSLGIVTPLIALACFGKRWLPSSGDWLVSIQRLLGVILFAMGLWLLESVLSPIALAFGVLLLIVVALFALGFFSVMAKSTARRAFQIFVIVVSLGWGINGVIDAVKEADKAAIARFAIPIASSAELDSVLADQSKDALIFFTADWCRYCPSVSALLSENPKLAGPNPKLRLLTVDLTHPSPETQALLQRLEVYGPPTIVLVRKEGRYRPNERILGTTNAETVDRLIDIASR